MTEHAVITGTFAEFKTVKTRSTVQLVIEIPIEAADQALAVLGGVPQPGKEQPVAVARLAPTTGPKRLSLKRSSLAQQAAMYCHETNFRLFLKDAARTVGPPNDAADAAEWVRDLCDVESRKQFDSDPEAGGRWLALVHTYEKWLEGRQ